jgi:tight adherence protein B
VIAVSAAFAALAVALLHPVRPARSPAPEVVRGTPAARSAASVSSPALVLVLAVAGGALVATAQGTTLAAGIIGLLASAAAARLLAAGRARTVARRREERVVEVCERLVGGLRAGQPPTTALQHCVEVWPAFDSVATAARFGADVPTALRRLGGAPGAAGLRQVADAWTVAQDTGAGLALALGQVSSSARESQATRSLVAAELASAQATARLVAALPVLTLVMGAGIGGDPWGFLLRTPAGLACLAGGLVLAFLGLAWIDRIAVNVMRR